MSVTALALVSALAPAAPEACPPRRLEVPLIGMNLAEEVEGEGYTSQAVEGTLARVAGLGANAVAIVVVLRLPDLSSDAIYTYAPPSRSTLTRLVARAHAHGLRVIVVPHLWVDGGRWRGRIARSGAAADAFFETYGRHVGQLAADAEAACVDALSLGVELKALTASPQHDARFARLIASLRQRFGGVLTYSANWDEASQVRFWGALDLISVNGFYPLAKGPAPSDEELAQGARAAMRQLDALAVAHERPVLLIEVGYKATPDNAREPWAWPDGPSQPVDEQAQVRAYRALAATLRENPRVVGALFWLAPTGTDRSDAPAFEPAWGFCPLGRPAEAVIREAARWAARRRVIGRAVTPPGPEAPQRRP